MFVDTRLSRSLFADLPDFIDRTIRQSPYVGAPRSIVPIARGVVSLEEGRNDKLLPLIEYPEAYHGRSFFHWRYSYSAHTSRLYAEATRRGPINYFPPGVGLDGNAKAFARVTGSPFVVSADYELVDDDFVLLGSHRLTHAGLERRPRFLNDGLIGVVRLYALRPVVERSEPAAFRHADFSRTRIVFRGPSPGEPLLRLPVTFFPDLRATTESGRRVELTNGEDGFTYARNDGSFESLSLSSFSLISAAALLAPFAAFLVCYGATRASVRSTATSSARATGDRSGHAL